MNIEKIIELLTHCTPLRVPIPPMLEETFGYSGVSRFVGFYWERAGDELTWADGQRSVCGAEWHAWLLFTQHHTVWPHLREFDFGSSDTAAEYYLLLDRGLDEDHGRVLYAAPRATATKILILQHGEPIPLQPEEARALHEALAEALKTGWHQVEPPSLDKIRRQMHEQATKERAMVDWLDEQ